MSGLVLALTMILTVIAALSAGIGLSYAIADAFFYLLGHRAENTHSPSLTTAEAGSGD
ncbi:MAG: hypothetical protein ABSD20_02915 [Terriglobales bacterium]